MQNLLDESINEQQLLPEHLVNAVFIRVTLTASSINMEISFLSSPFNSWPRSFNFTSSHLFISPQAFFTTLMSARVCGTKYSLSERTFTVLPTFKMEINNIHKLRKTPMIPLIVNNLLNPKLSSQYICQYIFQFLPSYLHIYLIILIIFIKIILSAYRFGRKL